MANIPELIAVFQELRDLLARPGNNFDWSSWEDAGQALAEIDSVLQSLPTRGGELPSSVLFAPTGPAQEVSLSSGWGPEFLALADRFDRAICDCPSHLEILQELGVDAQFGKITVWRCDACHQLWLRCQYDDEAFSHSGRWFMGAISQQQLDGLHSDAAREFLDTLPGYVCGGSYFDGRVSWVLPGPH
jgi:hypothetical protein